MKHKKINGFNKSNLLVKYSPLRILLLLFIFMVAGASKIDAQLPVVTVRFANPVYDCTDQTYCLDVEFQSNTASQQLFGMNVRFFYDDDVLELNSFTDFQGGYAPVSPYPPEVNTGTAASGPDLFGFTGPAEFLNGAIQLVNTGNPIYISTTGWTKLFTICFTVDDENALGTANFCPSVVWDLEYDPANGGFLSGDEGVVITVVNPDPNQDSSPASANAENFNWQFDGTPETVPYGAPASVTCIPTDIDPPAITGCPAEIIDLGCNPVSFPDCNDVMALGISASDACTGTVTPTCEAGQIVESNCLRTQTFTVTAEDDNGNSSTCDVTYSWIIDTEAPRFLNCPLCIINLGCTATPPNEEMVLASAGTACDNCAPSCDETVAYSAQPSGPPTNDGCSWTQTWTVTADAECGPSGYCHVTYVWFTDTEAPIFSDCPTAPIDLGCNPALLPDEEMALADAGIATDDCDETLDYYAIASDPVSNGCSQTQTWTVTADADCGPDATCEVTYTWTEDTQAPVFADCPVATIDLGYNPTSLPDETMALADAGTATDDCDETLQYSAVASGDPVSDICTYTQTWVVTADADCGPDATCEITYTWVIDTGDPVFTNCPVNPIDLGCNPETLPDCSDVMALGITANDGCAGPLTPVCEAGTPVSNGCMSSQTFTLTATDDNSNSATCDVTYIWAEDTQAPVFSGCPTTPVDLGCNPAVLPDETMAIEDAGTAADDCNEILQYSAVASDDPVQDGCIWSQTWTVTADADCGPDATCEVTYTWTEDTQAPVFADCPVATIDLGYNPASLPDESMALADAGTATDDCDEALDYSALASSEPVNELCTFTQTWIVTANADCGPDATCEVTYTWMIDSGDPEFTNCPVNPIDLGCNPETLPDCSDVMALGITANDGCAGPLTPVCEAGTPVGNGCLWSQTFTLTATDDNDNTATCDVTFIWTVDSDPPVFSDCPSGPIDLGCNPTVMPTESIAIADAGTAADDCNEILQYSAVASDDPAQDGCIWSQTWTVTADADCGPDAICNVTYIWTSDSEAPEFTVPSDLIIYFDADCEYNASPDETGHVTVMEDNCSDNLSPTYEDVVNDSNPCAVIITRTWSLSDDCGNESQKQQVITVMDTIAPTFNAPPDITIYANEDLSYNAKPTYTGNTTNKHDNCYVGYADYSDEIVEIGGEDTIAVITRTWSMEDDCGNQAEEQVQLITVRRIPDVLVNCTPQEYCIRPNGLYILSESDMNALAGYSSGMPAGIEVTVSPDYFTCDQVGEEVTVTVTATDRYGKSDQCTTTVLVCD